jgi:hypothetical protein
MGFIELIFMATLGALFVLLALLIYHYKRQLNHLESKYDTMFEIINSLVKEVYQCKNDLAVTASRIAPPAQYLPQNKTTPAFLLDHLIAAGIRNDEDADDEHEYDDDNEDADSDSDTTTPDYELNEYPSKQIYINPSTAEGNNISLDITEITKVSKVEEEPIQEEPSSTIEEVEVKPEPEPQPESDNEDDGMSIDRRKPYSKMNLQELKQEVIYQGINVDVSKMKKQDIAQLLRNHKSGV